MSIRWIAPILLVASLAAAAPVTGQWIPDRSPGDDESLAEWNRERLIERYRGTLGRFFTTGGFAMDPFGGPAYQMNAGLGLTLRSGDAVLLTAAVRGVPSPPEDPEAPWDEGVLIVGGAYELRGTRVLGPTPLGWRTALGLGVGVMHRSDLTAAMFEVTPTYDLIVRHGWSVPVGLRLSVSSIDSGEQHASVTRTFLGLHVGARWHLLRRERLD